VERVVAVAVKGFRFESGKVLKTFRQIGRHLGSMTPVLRIIGEYVAQVSKSSFEHQADPETGVPWKPLMPATQAFKAVNGWSAQALVRKRQLINSISYSITGPSVFTGPSAHHGRYHQLGAPRAGIPARPFMGLSASHENELNSIIGRWMSGGIK
jgi:phage virion morphogenesis protein